MRFSFRGLHTLQAALVGLRQSSLAAIRLEMAQSLCGRFRWSRLKLPAAIVCSAKELELRRVGFSVSCLCDPVGQDSQMTAPIT